MVHEKKENRWRYYTAMVGLGGLVADVFGKWSKSAASVGSTAGKFLEKNVGKALRVMAKGIGIGVGMVMAVWDGIRGYRELQEGSSVGWLYFASAGVSVLAFAALNGWLGATIFTVSATGVGLVLIVFTFAVAILIEIIKDDALQNWMTRCYFGKLPEKDRYKTIELEMQELKNALN